MVRAAATLIFNQLETGRFPLVQLSQLCEQPRYGFTASASADPVGPKLVRITDLEHGRINWDTVPYCECDDPEPYLLKPNDLLFARTGATTGKTHLMKAGPKAVYASYLIRVHPRPGVLPEYLYSFFQSDAYWKQLIGEKTGSAQPNVNGKKLMALLVPNVDERVQASISKFLDAVRARQEGENRPFPALPPFLEQQRRIVARIEELSAKIDEARSLRERAVEEAEILGSSALSTLFDSVPTDSLPTGWIWKTLPELLEDHQTGMITGPFGTLLHKSEIQSSGVPVLGIANVQANRFVPGFTDYVTRRKAESLALYELRENDIVVARSGTVGRSCLVPGHLNPMPVMSTNLMRLRLDQRQFLPPLLCRLFNGSRLIERHKDEHCRGSTRAFFTQKILSKVRIATPPIKEQRRIVAYLDDLQAKVDNLKNLQEETAKDLDALLLSILSKAFAGEL